MKGDDILYLIICAAVALWIWQLFFRDSDR